MEETDTKLPEQAENAASATPPSEPPVDDKAYQVRGKIADLSQWQGEIDWPVAARELDLCILRAQYGAEREDERYKEYAAGCEDHCIPYAAYSYCTFEDEATAKAEAHAFVERIKGTKPVFLALDLEPGGVEPENIREAVSAYIAELKALGVKRVAVYIDPNNYKTYNVDTTKADLVWLPSYGSNNGEPATTPTYDCDLWQYTTNGVLGGVRGRVSLNKLMDESRMAWLRGEDA